MSEIEVVGLVRRVIYQGNKFVETVFRNKVLEGGRKFLSESLLQGNRQNVFIDRMLFGGGAAGKVVESTQEALFGEPKAVKPVIGQRDSVDKHLLVFTSVISNEELNGETLNEMALQLSNGDLFCMLLFPDLHKDETMRIVQDWELYFV